VRAEMMPKSKRSLRELDTNRQWTMPDEDVSRSTCGGGSLTPGVRARVVRSLAFFLCCCAALWVAWRLAQFYVTGVAQRHHLESAWFILVPLVVLASLLRRRDGASMRQVHSSRVSPLFLSTACVIASGLLYWRSLGLGLLSDDYVLLTFLPGVETDWQFFRPLPLMVWSLVHPTFGPTGLHAINIVLHGINASLVFRLSLIIGLGLTPLYALGAAAVFLTFPAAVEGVAWNAGIFDLSLLTFVLLFLNTIVHQTLASRTVAILATVAALLCKETAVALPLLAWTLWLIRPVDLKAIVAASVICCSYAGLRLMSLDAPSVQGPIGYFVKEMLSRPFATLGVPWTIDEIRAHPLLLAVVPQVLVGVLLVNYAHSPKAGTRLVVPLIWVVAAVLPLLSYLNVDAELEGSRYLYLPLVGWAVLTAALSAAQPNRVGRSIGIATLAWFAAFGVYGTFQHQAAWLRAASLRDRIIDQAAMVAAEWECDAAVFRALPETVAGAQVFRNGFVEAAAMRGVNTVQSDHLADPRRCVFEWTGSRFHYQNGR
jgi:hypothetical protein